MIEETAANTVATQAAGAGNAAATGAVAMMPPDGGASLAAMAPPDGGASLAGAAKAAAASGAIPPDGGASVAGAVKAAGAAAIPPDGGASVAGAVKAAGAGGAAKGAGFTKMLLAIPTLAVLGLGGVILFEFWRGGKDAEEAKKKRKNSK